MIQIITSAKNISGIRTPIWSVKLGNRVETGKVEGSRSCFTKSRSRATTIGWCLSTTCSSSKSLRPSLSRQFYRHCYLAISVIFPKKVLFAEMAYHTVKMAHDHVKKMAYVRKPFFRGCRVTVPAPLPHSYNGGRQDSTCKLPKTAIRPPPLFRRYTTLTRWWEGVVPKLGSTVGNVASSVFRVEWLQKSRSGTTLPNPLSTYGCGTTRSTSSALSIVTLMMTQCYCVSFMRSDCLDFPFN